MENLKKKLIYNFTKIKVINEIQCIKELEEDAKIAVREARLRNLMRNVVYMYEYSYFSKDGFDFFMLYVSPIMNIINPDVFEYTIKRNPDGRHVQSFFKGDDVLITLSPHVEEARYLIDIKFNNKILNFGKFRKILYDYTATPLSGAMGFISHLHASKDINNCGFIQLQIIKVTSLTLTQFNKMVFNILICIATFLIGEENG